MPKSHLVIIFNSEKIHISGLEDYTEPFNKIFLISLNRKNLKIRRNEEGGNKFTHS